VPADVGIRAADIAHDEIRLAEVLGKPGSVDDAWEI
jgi:hypothetical protein